jgi:hypothetical protein
MKMASTLFPTSSPRWLQQKEKNSGQYCVRRSRATGHCRLLFQRFRHVRSSSDGILQ